MNVKVKNISVDRGIKIIEALKILNDTGKGILLVIDENEKLIGTLTDGDIRRALLKGYKLEDKIEDIVHYNPVIASKELNNEELKELFIKKAVKQIPIVDEESRVVDLISIEEILIPKGKENIVFILAGGKGTRLRELTKEIPKPMLKVGNEPLLHHIINSFKQYGFYRFIISVNYKSEIIENYFQNGYLHGVKIDYIKETKPLGTAGSIRLAKELIDGPFYVVNGDVYTTLNFERMLNYHLEQGFDITVGVKNFQYQIPYGVVESKDKEIIDIVEKPIINYLINAGIYCLNPNVIDFIPFDEYFEITDLIKRCILGGKRVGYYEINEYWVDIGQVEDYYKINEDFKSNKVGEKSDRE
ncbi:nucleotidyltransferase family protein [Caldicellulosiruptor acetigenus]|uniref:nucleotidyltransferase family protein n=1 Tax=Caldicellulosiruptor acetigenus TaxID=301953 RepID=UPI000422F4D8|nr:nucleotidyltransferase family protein [Caldicellulosiruptor acetigenus]WAM37239.1 nucleotidyltransferase family protein [Caldicellulosiruptor acetigenus]